MTWFRANIIATAIALNCLFLASALPSYDGGVYDTILPSCDNSIINITLENNNHATQGFVSWDLNSASNPSCNSTLYLQASPGHQLYVRFYQLRLACDGSSYLNIRGNTSSNSYCFATNLALYSSANFLYFTYYRKWYSSSTPSNQAIEFYYTEFSTGQCATGDHDDDDSDDSDDDDDDDGGSEFRCNNKRCIDARVKCDGFDNCGDWSDESSYTCGLSTGVIVAISITCTTLGVALLACILSCYASNTKKRRNRTAAAGHTNMAAAMPTQVAPMNQLQCTLPAPPPYKQQPYEVCDVYIGWAAPYDGMDTGAKPPQYHEISDEKK